MLEMGIDGSIVGEPWIGRSVVCSRYAFEYQAATRIVDGDADAEAACPADVVKILKLLATIASNRRRCFYLYLYFLLCFLAASISSCVSLHALALL